MKIHFFGCSFTQNTNSKFRATRPISMQEYVGHTHITKVQSNFLEFDLAYNDNSDYCITNFGNGSYGNFTIGSTIDKRVESLEGNDNLFCFSAKLLSTSVFVYVVDWFAFSTSLVSTSALLYVVV